MKKIILFVLLLLLTQITYGNNNLSDLRISINGKSYNGVKLYLAIDKKIDKKAKNNLEEKKEIYKKLFKRIEKIAKKNNNINIDKLKTVINYGLRNNLGELDKYYLETQKIILGYTKTGKEISAYYKGNPEDGYFGVFANIHGGYEYGTYKTALYLKEEFEKSGKTGWFIIPSINPEGLDYYDNFLEEQNYYIKGRVNSNNIDINRNFCTSNFELKTFIKSGEYFKTGIEKCNSEAETQVIINIFKKYKFNKIVSLHSEGNIFFIPDNSFDDERIINFGKQLHKILPNYTFDIDYKREIDKKQKIFDYEIDEGGTGEYTGTMETYIYEKYNIPIILIELEKHGKIDYDLINLYKLF